MGDPLFKRSPESRYLIREGRETPAEIEKSKKTPGSGMAAARNKAGGVYAWLVYDFAVGDAALKSGHKAYLSSISKSVAKYGKLYNRTGTILVAGFASPSGVHGQNVKLAQNRAKNVAAELTRQGIKRSWTYVKLAKGSDIYAVVKGIPASARQRSLCRGAYVVLWLMRDVPKPDKFSKDLRGRARGQILGRFSGYEKAFYYWFLDNYPYLQRSANSYVRLAHPREHGIFFEEPSAALTNDRAVWDYLRKQRREFKSAWNRLNNEYTGKPGHSFVPAGGDPVRCYQQLARWIAMDGHARAGAEHVFHFTQGVSIQKSFNSLIELINNRKFGEPSAVWNKIERYMKAKRIPLKVVRKPQR